MEKIKVLYDILMADDVVNSINENFSELLKIIPELQNEMGFDHKHPHHHLDVWNHTLLALSMADTDFEVRLVLLIHDIGKPFSWTERDGVRHFKNHNVVSMKMAIEILSRIGFKKEFINRISYLILNHDREITYDDIKKNSDLIIKLYEIQKCDALAHHPNKLEKRKNYLKNIKNKIYQKI